MNSVLASPQAGAPAVPHSTQAALAVLDEIEACLRTIVPGHAFAPSQVLSQTATGPFAQGSLSYRMPAPGEVDGEIAIPFLSVVAAPDLAETLLKLGRERLAECRRNPPPLSLPSGIARPLLEPSAYLETRELQTFILGECRGTLDRCLTLILGEDWVVRHDTNADPPIITAVADGVARPDDPTRAHEGFCYKVEALANETFCKLRNEVVKTGKLPPLAIVGTGETENSKPTKGEVRMWDEDAGQWITVPPEQAFVLQVRADPSPLPCTQ